MQTALLHHALESVIIPNSVTLIDIMAFSSCTTLKSVTIPKSVEKINDAAFGHCSPDLTIYGYKGTAAETYANDNEITFVALDKEDETILYPPTPLKPQQTQTLKTAIHRTAIPTMTKTSQQALFLLCFLPHLPLWA